MIDKKAAIEAYKIAERNAHDMIGNPDGYLALTGQCPVAVVERQAQRLGALLQQLDEAEAALAAERQRAENWSVSFENERLRADKLAAYIEELKGDQVPVANPALTYADSYRDMARQGSAFVPIWGVITDLERNIAPLFTAPQKPVVLLNSSTVMSRGYVVKQIEAAGCVAQTGDAGKDGE
jgi:hypothetical protein